MVLNRLLDVLYPRALVCGPTYCVDVQVCILSWQPVGGPREGYASAALESLHFTCQIEA